MRFDITNTNQTSDAQSTRLCLALGCGRYFIAKTALPASQVRFPASTTALWTLTTKYMFNLSSRMHEMPAEPILAREFRGFRESRDLMNHNGAIMIHYCMGFRNHKRKTLRDGHS